MGLCGECILDILAYTPLKADVLFTHTARAYELWQGLAGACPGFSRMDEGAACVNALMHALVCYDYLHLNSRRYLWHDWTHRIAMN